MSWLKRILGMNVKKKLRGPYDIICPDCFHKFNPNEVKFRSENNKEEKKVDTIRMSYVTKYADGIDEDTFIRLPEILIDDIRKENLIYDKTGKMIISVKDKMNCESSDRLCPKCHYSLPVDMGKYPCKLISVIGGTQTGKTVFLSSILLRLRNGFGNPVSITNITNHDEKEQLFSFEKQIIEKHFLTPSGTNKTMFLLPEATPAKQKQFPLIYKVIFQSGEYTEHPIILIFYDVPGEDLVRQGVNFSSTHPHLNNTDAFLFLADPERINGIAKKHDISNALSATNVLLSLYQKLFGKDTVVRFDKPIAITMSKSDILAERIPEDISRSLIMQQYKAGVNLKVKDFEQIHLSVREIIKKYDGVLDEYTKNHFNNYQFFAVSALGGQATKQHIPIDTFQTTSRRVEEPLLWLLYKLGYFK
jgi:hypothetical protein